MKKTNFVILVLFAFYTSILSKDGIQTNYVLIIAGSDYRLLPATEDIYCLANNIAKLENIFWTDSFEDLKDIVESELLSTVDEDDLLLVFMVGHGKGYASDPQNDGYGFSAVQPVISDTELVGFGKSFCEKDIIWQGPRMNYAYPRPRCIGLDKKDFFLRGNSKTHFFEGYGMKFVADVDKLELFDGTIVDDHSDWVKVIYYYAKCDANQDTLFQYETMNVSGDNQINGDDVSDIAFKVDLVYSSYAYGEYNIDNAGSKDYIFITRTDSGPQIAVSLNPGTNDPSEMPIHGLVSEDGYICSLDFNQDGDHDDFLYFNEEYQVGEQFIPGYRLAKLFSPLPSKKAVFAGNCYGGGLHDIFSGPQTGTYAATTDGATALALVFEEGYMNVMRFNSNNLFSGDKEKITLADIYNAGYQNIRNRCRYEFWGKVSYNDDSSNDFICGPISDSHIGFSSTIIAYADGREILSGVESRGVTLLPEKIVLYQNYPNPFNSSTIIPFMLSRPGYVKLNVFNVLGQEVMLLEKHYSDGHHQITFDGTNLPSGTYFYCLKVGDTLETKMMLLVK